MIKSLIPILGTLGFSCSTLRQRSYGMNPLEMCEYLAQKMCQNLSKGRVTEIKTVQITNYVM